MDVLITMVVDPLDESVGVLAMLVGVLTPLAVSVAIAVLVARGVDVGVATLAVAVGMAVVVAEGVGVCGATAFSTFLNVEPQNPKRSRSITTMSMKPEMAIHLPKGCWRLPAAVTVC